MARAPSNRPPDSAAADPAEGFLARWSRRKEDERRPGDASPAALETHAPIPAPTMPPEATTERPPERPPLPPVESLTADSDFSAFMRPDVPAPVQREALRKLWATVPSLAPVEIAEAHMADFNAVPTFPEGLKDTLFDAVRGLVEKAIEPDTPSPPATGSSTRPVTAAPTQRVGDDDLET